MLYCPHFATGNPPNRREREDRPTALTGRNVSFLARMPHLYLSSVTPAKASQRSRKAHRGSMLLRKLLKQQVERLTRPHLVRTLI